MAPDVSQDDRRIPEQLTKTLNTADGSFKLFEEIPSVDETTLVQVNNNSTGTQIIYLGFGQPAVSGTNPVNPGAIWIEAIDAQFRPFGGQIFILTSADGALVSAQRRIRTRK